MTEHEWSLERGAEPPTVSVILTTHDRRELVMRAIASVRAQTYEDWELLVIDDGSADGTGEALIPLTHEDPRIRYLHWANQGLAPARNWGIQVARGAFITFLDSDDEYAPSHLGRRVAHFAMSTSVQFLHGGYEIVGPEGADMVPDMNDPATLIPIRQCVVGGTFFGKTEVFRTVGGFRPIYGTDNDLFRRIQARQFLTDEISAQTYLYHRDSPDSMCDQAKVKRDEISSTTFPVNDAPVERIEHETEPSVEAEAPRLNGEPLDRQDVEAKMDIGI